MKFSISSLVSTLDPYQTSSFAVGLDMWEMSCNNLLLSNIKYVFYRNTSNLLIDTTYVIQDVL
jgi:hypothetical protein